MVTFSVVDRDSYNNVVRKVGNGVINSGIKKLEQLPLILWCLSSAIKSTSETRPSILRILSRKLKRRSSPKAINVSTANAALLLAKVWSKLLRRQCG